MAKPKSQDDRELRAKIFRTGRGQAVRLPKEVRFDEDQGEVRVRREGSRVILEPLDEWPEAFRLGAARTSRSHPSGPCFARRGNASATEQAHGCRPRDGHLVCSRKSSPTTIRPPGFITRRSSRRAAVGQGACGTSEGGRGGVNAGWASARL